MLRKHLACLAKKHLLALVFLAFADCGPSLSSRKVRFSCDDWAYEAQIKGIKGVIVEHAILTYQNKAAPTVLIKSGFSFYTPVGRFKPLNLILIPHATSPPWWKDEFSPPCKVFSQVDQSVGLTEQTRALGFYRVGFSSEQSPTAEQAPVQNRETPHDWIFIQNGRIGYWVNPLKMDLLALPILDDFSESNSVQKYQSPSESTGEDGP